MWRGRGVPLNTCCVFLCSMWTCPPKTTRTPPPPHTHTHLRPGEPVLGGGGCQKCDLGCSPTAPPIDLYFKSVTPLPAVFCEGQCSWTCSSVVGGLGRSGHEPLIQPTRTECQLYSVSSVRVTYGGISSHCLYMGVKHILK